MRVALVVVLVLTMFTGLAPSVPTAGAADSVGEGANPVPKTAVQPREPKSESKDNSAPPPEGTPQRAAFDRAQREMREAKQRVLARRRPLEVKPEPVAVRIGQPDGNALPVIARDRSVVTPADPCDPTGTEQYYAKYFPGNVVVSPTHNASGIINVAVRNVGKAVWPAGRAFLGYHLYTSSGVEVPGDYPRTPVSGLAPGQQETVAATVSPLDPGRWRIVWDLWIEGFGWFSERGVCAVTVEYVIANQPPSITMQFPPNEGTTTTRTPLLHVKGDDPDDWPRDGQVTYQFVICKDAAFTQGCHTSGWLDLPGYTVPDGVLDWNQEFWWAAKANDGAAITDPIAQGLGGHKVTVVVPAPDIWRTVGTGLGLATVENVVLPYGIWVHTERDAMVAGAGYPLQVQRAYSSGAAANHVGSFGHGWLSMFDSNAWWSPTGSTLTITYPDGRQEIFGKKADGTLVSRLDSGATNRVTLRDNVIEVSTSAQETLYFSNSGALQSIKRTGVGSLEFQRGTDGLVSKVVQLPSGRSLGINWTREHRTSDGRSCAEPLPALISEISAESPSAGQDPSRWRYSYDCARLMERCDPLDGCTKYHHPTAEYFATTADGRSVGKIALDTGWHPWGITDRRILELSMPGSQRFWIDLHRASEGEMPDYLEHVNGFGGFSAEYCSGNRSIRKSGKDALRECDQLDSLEFDELNRLRVKEAQGLFFRPRQDLQRLWSYNYQNGRFLSFWDENFNGFEMQYDGHGYTKGSFRFRDPSTQVTLASILYAPLDGVNIDGRIRQDYVEPQSMCYETPEKNYTYNVGGLLVKRTGNTGTDCRGNPVAGTGGTVTEYDYTSGTEAAVGSRRGGTGGNVMPALLLKLVKTAAGVEERKYNANGDLTEVRAPNGLRTVYDYDNLGRRVSQTEHSDTYPDGVRTEYRYDKLGRLVEQIDPATANQVTGQQQRLRTCNSYDRDSNLVSATLTGGTCADAGKPGARTTTYSYDEFSRLKTVRAPGGANVRIGYVAGTSERLLASIDDPRGGRVEFQRDPRGRVVSARRLVGQRAEWRWVPLFARGYDPAGRLISESDAIGRLTRFEWTNDDLQRRASRIGVPQPDGTQRDIELWRKELDGAGRVTKTAIGGMRTQDVVFDAESRPYSTTADPAGLKITKTNVYDAASRVVGRRVSDGSRTEAVDYILDAGGHVLSEKVMDLVTHYRRDQRGHPLAVTDPRGAAAGDPTFTSHNVFDELGRLIWTTAPPVTVEREGQQPATARPQTTYGYNVFGERTHVRDAAGNLVETVYDDAGNPVETRQPAYVPPGGSTAITPVTVRAYSPAGDLLSETDARGGRTDYAYDVAGRLLSITKPAVDGQRAKTVLEYDNADQITRATDPTGAVVEPRYDALGRLVSVTRIVRSPGQPDRRLTTSYDYNDAGEMTGATTPMGYRTHYGYDSAGRRVTTLLPGAATPSKTGYDLAGRITSETDTAGRAVQRDYDLAGRLSTVTRKAAGGTVLTRTALTYDKAGNLVAVKDPNGTRTDYGVDTLGRLTSITQPVTATTSIAVEAGYDITGNRVRVTDGNKNTTWRTYNPWNLVESVTEPATDAHPAPADRRWTTTYDAGGLPVKRTEPGGVTAERTFDAAGRLRTDHGYGGGAPEATRTFAYDLADRITSVNHPAGTQTFRYLDTGDLAGSDGPAGTSTYTYNADLKLTARADAAGTTTFTWRPDGRLGTAADPIAGQRRFGYDPTSAERVSETLPGGANRTYGRDAHGRVNAITLADAAGKVVHNVGYEFDNNGNTTRKTVTGGASAGGSYSYDLADRLTSWIPQDGSVPHHYTWDDADNRKSEELRPPGGQPRIVGQWDHDARNRLTAGRGPAGETHYGYTARGTLDSTTMDGGVPVRSSFDALDRLVTDGNQRFGYDGLDRVATRGAQTFSYAGLDPDAVIAPGETYARGPAGELLAARLGTTPALPVSDLRDDVSGWSKPDATATLLGTAGFDPFGVRTGSGTQSAVGFQGDWTDPGSNRVNMHARWYNPGAASFASRDNLDLPLDSTHVLNRYGYGEANPQSNTDPTGHNPAAVVAGGAWGIGELLTWFGAAAAGGALIDFSDEIVGGIGDAFDWLWDQITSSDRPAEQVRPAEVPAVQALPVAVPAPAPAQAPRQAAKPKPKPAPYITGTSTALSWKTWTETTTSHTSTHRIITTTHFQHLWERTTTFWSTGAAILGQLLDLGISILGADHIAIPTVDPNRVTDTILGGLLDEAGQMLTTGADAIIAGSCGLTGTLTSCYAEVLAPPVGAGCAPLAATSRSCQPVTPRPGNPSGQRETLAAGAGAGAGVGGMLVASTNKLPPLEELEWDPGDGEGDDDGYHTSRSREKQQSDADDAWQAIKRAVDNPLTRADRRKWHDAITGQGYDYHRIVREGIEMFRNKGE